MRQSIILGVCGLVMTSALMSCEKKSKETPSGYPFDVVESGDGKLPVPGQVMFLDVKITDQNDSVWFQNRASEGPEMVMIAPELQKTNEKGITEVFRMMSKGDSVHFPMRAKDVFENLWRTPLPSNIDAESKFSFRMVCRDIMDEPEALKVRQKRDSIQMENQRVAYKEELVRQAEASKEQLATDISIIDNYLKSKNVQGILTTPSGLRYSIKKKGEGAFAQPGNVATVKYAGSLLDGTEFDSGEYPVRVDAAEVIQGWDQILLLMNQGMAVTVYVPSTLAYQSGGRAPKIGPNAILVFEMEVINIQK